MLFRSIRRVFGINDEIVMRRVIIRVMLRVTFVEHRVEVEIDRLAPEILHDLRARNPRLVRASQKERDDLYEITGGNPLFIRWITG